jgi:hypothetical protein
MKVSNYLDGSQSWVTLWVTGLKWFKKQKGKNIFILEAASMCLVF